MFYNFKPQIVIDQDREKKVNALIDATNMMDETQLRLLIEITCLTVGRPDRQQYARNYTGKMKDLPALLAQI